MTPMDEMERLAARRYFAMNALRIGSLGAVIVGIASTRSVIDLPHALGVVLAVVGMIAFFFGPRMLARRWKSTDTDAGDADQ